MRMTKRKEMKKRMRKKVKRRLKMKRMKLVPMKKMKAKWRMEAKGLQDQLSQTKGRGTVKMMLTETTDLVGSGNGCGWSLEAFPPMFFGGL